MSTERQTYAVASIIVVGLLSIATARLSNPPRLEQTTTVPKNDACSAPEYRQLDFWIGDWDVFDAKGILQGHNLVQTILGTCALQEYYIDVSGLVATSVSMYDASRQVWSQTYLSTLGTVLYVEGYLRAQNVVLTGTHVATDGRIALHRMMWTAKGKEAYQLWEYSKDGGKIWEPIYEGVLRPAKKPFPLKELQQRGLAMAGDERQ